MNREESKRPGRRETRALKINLPPKGGVRRMFAHGLPREKRKGTVSMAERKSRADTTTKLTRRARIVVYHAESP